MNTLLKYVAKMWCVASNLKSVLYEMPHGPGADFVLALLKILLISLGLKGAVLKGVKCGLSGVVGRFGNQCSWVKSTSWGTL